MIRDYTHTGHNRILSLHLMRIPMFFAGYRLYRVQYLLTMYEATWVSPQRS